VPARIMHLCVSLICVTVCPVRVPCGSRSVCEYVCRERSCVKGQICRRHELLDLCMAPGMVCDVDLSGMLLVHCSFMNDCN
jgi:hypothetical protein